MPGRLTSRIRRRPQALRRHRAAALIALAGVAGALAADAPAKPPKPKPPEVTLLTATEQGALRREGIEIKVFSRAGSETRVKANFVVDGYPEDYPFRLGPEQVKLKGNDAKVKLRLSPRMLEVLDFAIKSCRGASLAVDAKVGKRVGSLSAGLRRPREC